MAINRRDLLKMSAGSGLLLASGATPAVAAPSKALPPDAVGMLYDATLCIGCKSCMVNCKKYNSVEEGGALYSDGKTIPYEHRTEDKIYDAPQDLSENTLSIIKAYKSGTGENKDKPENGFSFIKMNCLHCVDPACVSVCPVGALQKDPKNGVVTYDKDKCFGCRYCQVACPFSIPKFEFGEVKPKIIKCQLCHHRYDEGGYAACCEFCPTGASLFGKVSDLREEAKRRLTLKAGEYYDFPIQHIDFKKTLSTKVSGYYDHVYGLDEAGGTQYLLMAGVSFDKLGFNPNITDTNYPTSTWEYISKVPYLIGALLAAGTACHIATKDKDKDKS
jgi:Fe-S-cluster-containing dehydrogenase component